MFTYTLDDRGVFLRASECFCFDTRADREESSDSAFPFPTTHDGKIHCAAHGAVGRAGAARAFMAVHFSSSARQVMYVSELQTFETFCLSDTVIVNCDELLCKFNVIFFFIN